MLIYTPPLYVVYKEKKSSAKMIQLGKRKKRNYSRGRGI